MSKLEKISSSGSDEIAKPEIVTLGEDQWEIYKQLRIVAVSDETAFRTTPEDEQRVPEEIWRKDLRRAIAGERIYLFLKQANEYIAMIGATFFQQEKMKHVAGIHDVYVDPRFRGRGVGGQLMRDLIDKIKSENSGVEKLELNVFSSQVAAIKLYNRLGFKEVGTWHKRLKVNGQYYDHVFMEKFLKEGNE